VPMFRRARRQLVQGRQVWIGNAAQALHPVAGQGLNLGIRDAFELAQQLGNAHAAGTDMLAALQAYARQRRTDRSLSIGLTDALARMFSLDLIRPFQSIALGALDLSPNLRRLVASHFMFGWR
jgi:2-octaprenyl-6-methoxyphenol hydroxylase